MQGRFAEAAARVPARLELAPGDAETRLLLARALAAAGETSRRARGARAALALAPASPRRRARRRARRRPRAEARGPANSSLTDGRCRQARPPIRIDPPLRVGRSDPGEELDEPVPSRRPARSLARSARHAAVAAGAVWAICTDATTGPDVIVASLYGIDNYVRATPIDDKRAYSMGTKSLNVGDTTLLWQGSTTLHPVIGQGLYRLKTDAARPGGRLEQVGLSWLKHGFTALARQYARLRHCTDATPAPAACSGSAARTPTAPASTARTSRRARPAAAAAAPAASAPARRSTRRPARSPTPTSSAPPGTRRCASGSSSPTRTSTPRSTPARATSARGSTSPRTTPRPATP